MDVFEAAKIGDPFPFIHPETGKTITMFPATYSNEVKDLCKLMKSNAVGGLDLPKKQINLYYQAQSLFQEKKFRQALIIFKVLKSFMKSPYLTGVHTTIASCYSGLNESENTDKYNELIKEHLLMALELKPSNQIALNQLYQLYFYEKNYFGLVNECLPDVSNEDIATQSPEGLTTTNNLSLLLRLIFASIPDIKKSLTNSEITQLVEVLHNKEKIVSNEKIALMIRHIVLNICWDLDEHLSYQYTMKALESATSKSEKAYLYNRLGLSLTNFDITDAGKKALDYFHKALNLTDLSKKVEIEAIRTNIAMGYILNKDYQLAIELLIPKIKQEPTNTDLYNLGRAYHLQKHYLKAEENIQKALLLLEDEITYELLADNDYCLENYAQAIENYKHSIFFIQNNPYTNRFKDSNDKFVISSIVAHHSEKVLERLYSKLIQCYMETDNFKHAYYYLGIAIKNYPDKMSFKQQINILEKIIEVKENYIELDKEFKKIDKEYKNLHTKFVKNRTVSQELATTLFKIQSLFENTDIEDIGEDDFTSYQRIIGDKVIKKILMNLNKSNKNSIHLSEIEKNIRTNFSFLSEKSIKFLYTAEYLYTSLKDEKIDFAPIMVEYCKVIENELLYRLFNLNIIGSKKDYSLGKIIATFESMPNILDTKVINSLHEIRLLRNGSAHTGETTINKIERIRKKYYKEKGLINIINYCERLEIFFSEASNK